jgi:hypothetical protein
MKVSRTATATRSSGVAAEPAGSDDMMAELTIIETCERFQANDAVSSI